MSRIAEAYLGDSYPDFPGYKEPTTSRAAAQAIAPTAANLRAMAFAKIAERPSTPDEVASSLHLSVLSIRPRITELAHKGLIERTGDTRPNASGKQAAVWRRRVDP